jgi:hypothetical protein
MHTGERSCNSPNGLRLPPRHHSLRGCCGLLFGANTKHLVAARCSPFATRSVFIHRAAITSGHFQERVPKIQTRPDEESWLANWRTSNGLPSASDPETEADRTPRESLLACMTANREPSNQSFETDREATVCTASRRFLPLCGREAARTRGTSLAGRYLFGSLSALGLGCSLIPGARWLCR